MLRDRLRSNRRICHIDFSAFLSILVALATLFVWTDFGGSLYHHSKSLEFPKARNAVYKPESEREDALLVSIQRDGKVFFDVTQVGPDDLPPKLRDRIKQGAPKTVYLRADGRAHYKAVKEVLDEVRDAGLSKVAFMVEQRR